jgi:hypothetical protein
LAGGSAIASSVRIERSPPFVTMSMSLDYLRMRPRDLRVGRLQTL